MGRLILIFPQMLLYFCLLASWSLCGGFYIPGVAPVEFQQGDEVEVKVGHTEFHCHGSRKVQIGKCKNLLKS